MLSKADLRGAPFDQMKVGDSAIADGFNGGSEQFQRLAVVDAAILSEGREPHSNSKLRNRGAHVINDLEEEAKATLQGAAVLIRSQVGPAFKELIDQMTVCGLNLDPVKAGLLCVDGCPTKVLDDCLNLPSGQCARSFNGNLAEVGSKTGEV